MSWGERSCKSSHSGCKLVTPMNCNVDCAEYKWDKKTKPDSVSIVKSVRDLSKKKSKKQKFNNKRRKKRNTESRSNKFNNRRK